MVFLYYSNWQFLFLNRNLKILSENFTIPAYMWVDQKPTPRVGDDCKIEIFPQLFLRGINIVVISGNFSDQRISPTVVILAINHYWENIYFPQKIPKD